MLNKPHLFASIISTLLLLVVTQVSQGAIYDAANDFTAGSNSGTWTYGYRTFAEGVSNTTIHLNGTQSSGYNGGATLDAWSNGPGSWTSVFHNNDAPFNWNGVANVAANELGLHPGASGEYSIVRFSAPNAGTYSVNSAFAGLTNGNATTSDVHVVVNGVSYFDQFVQGANQLQAYSGSFTLTAGGYIDFVVGFGSNGNYYSDPTSLDATVASTPEPATLAIWGGISALGLIAGYRRRKLAAA